MPHLRESNSMGKQNEMNEIDNLYKVFDVFYFLQAALVLGLLQWASC